MNPALPRSSWPWLPLWIAFAAAFLLLVRGPQTPAIGFLIDEPGQNLYLADQILGGKALYHEVFTQYGPLPIQGYALAAGFFGNSAETFTGYMFAAFTAAFLLAGRLLGRWLRPGPALAWLTLILGGVLLRSNAYAYPPFEGAFFLLACLCWRRPDRRSPGRALAMGICLGLMQTAKFGSAFLAGLSILVADVWQGRVTGRPDGADWWRTLAWTAAGALLVEGALAGWAWTRLTPAEAKEFLWPSYMRASYAGALASYEAQYGHGLGYFQWFDFGMFAGTQWPPVAASAAAALLALALAARPARDLVLEENSHDAPSRVQAIHARDYAGLAVGLGAFFPVGLSFYLPHLPVATHYAWIPLLAAGGCFALFRTGGRVLLGLALFPGAWSATVKPLLLAARAAAPPETLEFPNGQRLAARPGDGAAFQAVLARNARLAARAGDGGPPRWFFFPATFGWEHYGAGRLRAGAPGFRHWWFLPAFVRPREEPGLVEALGQVDAVLVDLREHPARGVTANPSTWGWMNPRLSPATSEAMATRLGPPEELLPNLWCFPVLPQGAGP